jgi:hypothetical protein
LQFIHEDKIAPLEAQLASREKELAEAKAELASLRTLDPVRLEAAARALARILAKPDEDTLWHWSRGRKTAEEYVEAKWPEYLEDANEYARSAVLAYFGKTEG